MILELKASDVIVNDHLLGYKWTDGYREILDYDYVVTDIENFYSQSLYPIKLTLRLATSSPSLPGRPVMRALLLKLTDTVRVSREMQVTVDVNQQQRFPHVCPRCGAPAYAGLFVVDCSKGCRSQ